MKKTFLNSFFELIISDIKTISNNYNGKVSFFILDKECNDSANIKKNFPHANVDVYHTTFDLVMNINSGRKYDLGIIKNNIVEDKYNALSMLIQTIDPNIKIKHYNDGGIEEHIQF